jgi:hypothetical protein
MRRFTVQLLLAIIAHGTVTATAAPLRAATRQLMAETVVVVEHSPRPPRPAAWYKYGVGVTLSFYPCHSAFFLFCSSAPCASSLVRRTASPPQPTCSPPTPTLDDARHLCRRRRRRRLSPPRHCRGIGTSPARSPLLQCCRPGSGELPLFFLLHAFYNFASVATLA